MFRPLLLALPLFAAAAVAAAERPAVVRRGPPPICFVYDIGAARSLPWTLATDMEACDPAFDVQRLVPETLAILDASRDSIVHLETLRRAAMYGARPVGAIAATDRAPRSLPIDRLLRALLDRALRSSLEKPDPFALLDAGFLLEARGCSSIDETPSGERYLERAAREMPNDAGFQIGAAVAAIDARDGKVREGAPAYVAAALRCSSPGSIAWTNAVTFGNRYLGKDAMEKLAPAKAREVKKG